MADNLDKYEKIEKEMEDSIEIDKTDEDILKNPQKEFAQGIETEEYDILPPVEPHEDIEQELEEKEGIEVEYTFNGDEIREGLSVFQAATILKRNLIYSGILLLVFFAYMVNILKNPGEPFSIFLAAMCIAVMGFIWYLPKNHIKKTAQAADTTEMKFSMKIYDNCVKIGEDGGSMILVYNKEITSVYETPNLYMVCAGKERIFILPKRCLNEEQIVKVKQIFKTEMKDKYIEKLETK